MALDRINSWKKKAVALARNSGGGRLNMDLDIQGLVFNIQKFSIDDGPGIRTTVFMKGCPFRCPWCSNPESINPYPEVITKFDALCKDCGRCQDSCEIGAIKVIESLLPGDDRPRERTRDLDRHLCNRCMKCVEACPTGALSSVGEAKTVREVLEVVEQDRPFYENSGGGVTLSGGEPLMQPDFALALLRESKRRGLHTALDTCGQAPTDSLEALLPFLDLVLYDVKHTDPTAHEKAVGSDNLTILENLRFLSGKVAIWLRVPLIPGFNDDLETLRDIVELAGEVRIERLFFLPYHRWGSGKYPGLGREYELANTGEISANKLETVKELCGSSGIAACEIASE